MTDEKGSPTRGPEALDRFVAFAASRRSVRRYLPDPVPETILLRILEAARWAPSAVNSQPWHFVVVTDPERKRALYERAKIAGLVGWSHLVGAPVVVAVVGDPRNNRFYVVDCSLAGMNLLLAAHAAGLGACWIGGFTEERIRDVVGVPRSRQIIGLVTLGYPKDTPKAPPRLPLERLVSREVYDPTVAATRGERFRLSGLYSLRKRVLTLFRRKRPR